MAENRYCDIEAFLDTIPQYAGESGVVRAGALLEELGHPEKTLKIIHVAGSNGKGSVCAYLNRILIQHGFRTGLFTSPHLVDVRERIRIDNETVSKSDLYRHLTGYTVQQNVCRRKISRWHILTGCLAWHCCYLCRNRPILSFWKLDLAGGSMPPMQYKIRCCP